MSEFSFDFEKPSDQEVVNTTVEEFGGSPVAVTPESEAGKCSIELTRLRSEVNELRKEQSEDEKAKVELERELTAATAAYNKLKREIGERLRLRQESIYDRRRSIRNLERNIENVERKLKLALEKLRDSERYHYLSATFDKATAGAPWREWAYEKQIECAKIIAANQRVLCGNRVGTGKSLTSIISADMLEVGRLLVITPADVTNNFVREIQRWAPHRPLINLYKMTKVQRQAALKIATFTNQFTVTVNYDAWRRDKDLIQDLINLQFQMVILDESHNIKNTSSAAFDGVKKIVLAENACPRCNSATRQVEVGPRRYASGCSVCNWQSNLDQDYKLLDRCSVKYLLPMTGTPILNRPQELYPLLHLMMPTIFEREMDFLYMYCEKDKYTGYWRWAPGGLERLQKHLSGYYIAYSMDDMGIEIPPQQIITHEMDFDFEKYPKQWEIMQQLSEHAQILLESGKSIKALATIALITRKRQANVWPAGISLKDEDGNIIFTVGEEVTESIKVDKAFEMISDDLEGERVVVFSQFKGPLHALCERLNAADISSIVLDGSTPESVRDRIKIDFDRKHTDPATATWKVVLCNYKTGGVGLNFTGATQTIVLDEEWNPGKNEQAYGRTARIGQTDTSTVHILRLNKTIDTWLAALIKHKQGVVNGFESATEGLSDSLLTAMQSGEII